MSVLIWTTTEYPRPLRGQRWGQMRASLCWIETATGRSITVVSCSAISQRNQRRQRASLATDFLRSRNTISRKMAGMAMESLTKMIRFTLSYGCGKTQTTTGFLSRRNCTHYPICMWTQYHWISKSRGEQISMAISFAIEQRLTGHDGLGTCFSRSRKLPTNALLWIARS